MKKTYGILLCILFFATGCNSDQSPTVGEHQQNEVPSTYESITKAYQQKQEALPTNSTKGFLSWLKELAQIDAKAAAAYALEHGMQSDWKEALIVGATASAEAAISGNSSKTGVAITDAKPYATLVLSHVQQINSASNHSNFMDDIGYTHYILVNEVLKDSTLSQLSPSERKGAIYDKIYDQAQKLGIHAIYDRQKAIALLDKIQKIADDDSDQYYAQLFTFKNLKDNTDFKMIAKLYTHTFNKISNYAVFAAYSKEMEAAVLQDDNLSQLVKEVLLLEMATFRFGYTYYSANL